MIDVQTNVLNESATTQQVTLTTQIVDAAGNVVVTRTAGHAVDRANDGSNISIHTRPRCLSSRSP